jgi:hypothetical protein
MKSPLISKTILHFCSIFNFFEVSIILDVEFILVWRLACAVQKKNNIMNRHIPETNKIAIETDNKL